MNDKSFEDNVKYVLSMTDAEAKENKAQGNFISIMKKTPIIILENVKEAENLEVIIRFDALYLALRENGVLEEHYHNLGEDIATKLPNYIANPEAIVRMKNGRLNLLSKMETVKGANGIISIELNDVKDINSKYTKYNLVISAFTAKDNYVKNLIEKNGESVAYKKEELPQVNPQLYKWLAIFNDNSSTTIISNSSENSNTFEKKSLDSDKNIEKEPRYSLSTLSMQEIETIVRDNKVPDGWFIHGRMDRKDLDTGFAIQLTKNVDVEHKCTSKRGSSRYKVYNN